MSGGRPKSDEKERFLAKVKLVENGCIEWQGTKNRGGYGKFYFRGKQDVAHRVSYELFVEPISKGRWVLHRCDNRKCVNVDHLFLGNCKDNILDMDTKGRRGTKSKLTYADVENIKKLLAERYSQQKIAEMFNVNQTAVSRIKLNKTTMFLQERI
jgi:hypothetical protein